MFSHFFGTPFATLQVEIDLDRACEPHAGKVFTEEQFTGGARLNDRKVGAFGNDPSV
jgi:hypothetical protein